MNRLLTLSTCVLLAWASTVRAADTAPANSAGMYHVVAMKFKEGTTADELKQIEEAFEGLKAKVPGVTSLHWGTNVSPEQRDKGFTHCFVLTFAGAKDRDVYLTHPAHQAFIKLAGPHIADVLVLDFEPRL